MKLLRKLAGIGLLLFAIQSVVIAFGSPMFAASAPLLLAAGAVALTFVVWPKDQIGR